LPRGLWGALVLQVIGQQLSLAAAAAILTRLKALHGGRMPAPVEGVGRFTADGVLMLALRRPDVWPAADLALRRAVERIWGLDPRASVEQVDALGERFRPWRTLAAAYLYSSVEG
jgi:DNA-3-methyladenine glycosylase II